jgi:hypothetical protein
LTDRQWPLLQNSMWFQTYSNSETCQYTLAHKLNSNQKVRSCHFTLAHKLNPNQTVRSCLGLQKEVSFRFTWFVLATVYSERQMQTPVEENEDK